MNRRASTFCLCVCIAVAGGCSSGGGKIATDPAEARAALDFSLKAWCLGRSIDRIGAKPPVYMVDSVWRSGRKIESFDVLDEKVLDDGIRRFTARLTNLAGRAESSEDVDFYVYDRNPILIYRAEDYVSIMETGGVPEVASPSDRAD